MESTGLYYQIYDCPSLCLSINPLTHVMYLLILILFHSDSVLRREACIEARVRNI